MNGASILVVEDQRTVAAIVALQIEKLGYRVVSIANDGEQAVALANKLHPDLVLMDIMLGAMDGIEAAKRISAHRPTPIVYMTAYGDETVLERAKATRPLGVPQ